MMKRYIYIIIVLMVGIITSCKQYLDVKPYGKVIPKTTEEFSAFLHNILNKLDYGYDNQFLGNCSSDLELAAFSDNLDASIKGQGNALPTYVGVRLNSMQNNYRDLYAVIRDLNLVIENIKPNTETDKNVLGAAYAMRGVCYFNLIRMFSPAYDINSADQQLGVPIVTKYDIEEKPQRSSLLEVVGLISNDLKTAISYNPTNEIYRFNTDIAKFYLLRTYMWSENWKDLIPLAEELSAKYPLLDEAEYTDMMNSVNAKKGNVLLKSYMFSDNQTSLVYNGSKNFKSKRPVSIDFIKLFKEKDKDVRYALSFNTQRQTVKVLNARIRAAEIYFMLAEAYAHKGEDPKALEIINQIRDKRIEGNVHYKLETLPEVDPDYIIKVDCEDKPLTSLMYTILTERQKEFFVEGDRWWELKRNGSPEFWVVSEIGLKFTTYKYMYTAPIYKRDVDLIKGLKQNEGYEE